MSKVYLDMDDTLVDFAGGLRVFNSQHDLDISRLDIPREKWTLKQVEGDKFVVDCMNTPGFFRNLPMMEGADKLWVAAGKPYVLTAWPKTTNDRDRVKREKREWITDMFGEIPDDRFIYCSREDKALHAATFYEGYQMTQNTLVDDMESNIKAWIKAGGRGILFRNMEQAINDLKGHNFDVV